MNKKKVTETLKIEFVTKDSLRNQLMKFVDCLGGYITDKGNPDSLYHGEISICYFMSIDEKKDEL